MANIQERRDRSGKLISYSIRVFRGRAADGTQLKPYTATFNVEPTWTERSAKKKAETFAAQFEAQCKSGVVSDSRLKFSEYCDYVIDLKDKRGTLKHSTFVRYKELTERIYPEIGHIKLKDLRTDHLNNLYSKLSEEGVRSGNDKATAKIDLATLLKNQHMSRAKLAEVSGVPNTTVCAAVRGETITLFRAEQIAKALGKDINSSFVVEKDTRPLSAKTVLEHHRLISTVLTQAVKEGLVPVNVSSRCELPKADHKEVRYFQPEEIAAIRDALEKEPIMWKVLVHLFLVTGARRGEVLGLRWFSVDEVKNRIHICNNVQYASDIGIYEDTPKTEKSERYISIPQETVELLKNYRAYRKEELKKAGVILTDQGFVFSQPDGKPLHPDSVNNWLNGFSKRHGLPHINPHAFRHSMASLLYFNNVDSVSISHRLGHAQVSTTQNIYAHVIKEADERNADIISDIFLKAKQA